jgi:hypothetical protein
LHLEGAVLALAMAPAILAGLPLGRRLARRLSAAAFSRAVLGLDAVLVSVGLASSANTLGAPPGAVALGLAALALVVVSTLWLQTALARQAPRNDADVAGLGRAVEAPQP